MFVMFLLGFFAGIGLVGETYSIFLVLQEFLSYQEEIQSQE